MISVPKPASQQEVWDRLARRAISGQQGRVGQRKDEFYLAEAYLGVSQRALGYLSADRPLVLKTDLWNEVVDKSRNVLGGLISSGKELDLYGMDISAEICRRAEVLYKDVQVTRGDVRSLPFADRFFDVVLDLSTIDHIPEGDISRAIEEYQRVLRKDGILVLVFWQKDWFFRLLDWLVRLVRGKSLVDNQTQFAFSTESIERRLDQGFEILEKSSLGAIFPLVFGWRLARPIFNLLPRSFYRRMISLELGSLFCLPPGRLRVFIARKL